MAKKRGPIKDPVVFAKVHLRGASRKWYANNEVYKRCNVSRGVYRCEGCQQLMKKTNLQIDHIEPIVDVKEGHTTMDNWINRAFVPADKLQALCSFTDANGAKYGCHPSKSSHEQTMRAHYRKDKPKKSRKKVAHSDK